MFYINIGIRLKSSLIYIFFHIIQGLEKSKMNREMWVQCDHD